MRFRFWLGVDLIYHYAKDLGNLKSPEENIQSSLGFFKDLLDLPVLENFKNIQLQSQFNNILSSNAKYLVHEYLNQSYESFDFAKLVAELSQAKLQFASPSHFALQARLILLGCYNPLIS
ncbi:hypothetical protein VN0656_08090 [Helicobacter pylori]